MVKIRLTRIGSKNSPKYRVIAVDSRAKRDGKFLEVLGSYNPTGKEPVVALDLDRIKHWISLGAQPSDRVARLIKQV